jgi:hypothetical protein
MSFFAVAQNYMIDWYSWTGADLGWRELWDAMVMGAGEVVNVLMMWLTGGDWPRRPAG